MLAAAFAAGLLLALVLTPAGIRIAWQVGYLDHPEARKLHTSATALLGGVVVFTSALAAWVGDAIVLHRPAHSGGVFLFAGALVALLVGLWDDRHGMRPLVKLLGQIAAGGALLASGRIPHFGLPLPVEVGLALLALAGACIGFLPYNFPRARIFLGDAGSLLLGYSLGASALLAFTESPRGWGSVGPLLMLAYPAFDLIFVVVNRVREGRKIYLGGQDHTNHRLASVLRCPTTTVLLLWLNGAALCASGLAVLRLNRPLPTLLLSGLWVTLLLWAGLRLSSVPPAPRTQ